jgi:predicted Zn-dependent protease
MKLRADFLSPLAALVLLVAGLSSPFFTQGRHRDVENIGKRVLSENPPANLMPPDEEAALGARVAAEFESGAVLLDDPATVEYVRQLGENLVRHSDDAGQFVFKVRRRTVVDLTTLPDGRIYVNTGLLQASANEAELAAALCNGIAHAAARHSALSLARIQFEQVPALPASLLAWHWSSLERDAETPRNLETYANLVSLETDYVLEADQLGIQYLWNSGYDPGAYARALRRLLELRSGGSELPASSRDFSRLKERIEAVLQEQRLLPDRGPYTTNSPAFVRMQSTLSK